MLLRVAFHPGSDRGIVNRSLARMASGKVALVPASARSGDLIDPLRQYQDDPDQFLFLRIEPVFTVSGRTTGDIPASVDAHQLPGERGALNSNPTITCEYVGGCFINRFTSFPASELYDMNKPFNMVLN
jgi:hypothetical protein